jgi:hypothetical protein
MTTSNRRFYDTSTSVFLDTSTPNMARIFDYLLGGSANFEADRQAAEQMLKIIPSLRKWVRLRRAFVQEAAQVLYEEGFRQFLDLGSGLPAEDHIHIFAPEARIIYCDINPMAVSYGNSLFAELVNVKYIYGDVREIEGILTEHNVRQSMDKQEKTAIGLNSLPLFLTEDEGQTMAQALFNWAPVDSKLFLVFTTRRSGKITEKHHQMLAMSTAAGLPLRLYTIDQNIEMLNPWRVDHMEPITDFLGLPKGFITEDDREGINVSFYAAFLTKDTGKNAELG